MKIKQLVILLALFGPVASAFGDLNVLVIGSTHSYSEGEKSAAAQKAFNGAAVAGCLRKILAGDPKIGRTANVVFEDVYRTKMLPTAIGGGGKLMDMEYRCHSLAQYYFWPERRVERLASLRGAGKTKWNYVVILGDPYIIANMPGVYAEGVNLIANVVRKGRAKPILLMGWPEAGSTSTTAHFGEVTYRVGKGVRVPVAPAGCAWGALTRKGKSADHPSAEGAYLAAACVYSELFARSAPAGKTSQKALAQHALKTVKANKTKTQSAGRFEFKSPFAMKYVTAKSITYNHTGSSSERGIQGSLEAAIKRCKVSCRKVQGVDKAGAKRKIDFNFGRANTIFEANKKYKVAPDKFGRSYGFPMQEHSKTAAVTMLYGIDKRYMGGRRYEDGTDLGIAYDMIRQGEVASDIRAVPIRLMWAKLHDLNSKSSPLRDKWHMSRNLNEAIGTYMYTLLSGQCPVPAKPSAKTPDAVLRWSAQKIGYQTAVRMAHLQPTLTPARR
ncbi:MAG: hypothetical protein HN350_15090 [Phycisphaerales bacterium]|jgi:hypothetical protein|nr:hypothetical protein [Phycisphaerales bacterium]